MTPAETLRAAADRLDRDAADLAKTWKTAGLAGSDRMARRIAIDAALAALLRNDAQTAVDLSCIDDDADAEVVEGYVHPLSLAVARAVLGETHTPDETAAFEAERSAAEGQAQLEAEQAAGYER